MDEELKPCPFCHREAQQTLCSGLVSCAYEDCPAFLLAVFPENWNTRAQLPSKGGEAVAWHTEDHLTEKSATTYDREVAERWRAKGWPVTPLYTHPVDQVADDLTMVKVPRELANIAALHLENSGYTETGKKLRALLNGGRS